MIKQNRVIGDFLEIKLPNGKLAYARVLDKASVAIYNVINKKALDISEVMKHDMLFTVAVYKDVIVDGRWRKIGNRPLEEGLKKLPMKFIQDELSPDFFELYNPNNGDIIPAKKEDCIGLERASVWEAENVEERIVDHFNGKSNIWVEKMKLK
ncbi:Immunity protein 26 [Pedobacter westerhofensis]|uniref:Immunity protein 26 n=1 Tax=Pedobacter westerhofensis TaxID=425512 RepID=A0A521C823_9SPHI|nr:immunity 26/phosphotriesterase HocA family protein [Pedobacter westerhofensis]SMO54860.1 Immunity protein 26 [Pedobacter westerhofensis]